MFVETGHHNIIWVKTNVMFCLLNQFESKCIHKAASSRGSGKINKMNADKIKNENLNINCFFYFFSLKEATDLRRFQLAVLMFLHDRI